MRKHRKRKLNYLRFTGPFLFSIAVLVVLNYFVTGYLQKSELKQSVKKNTNALVPISFKKDGIKISVYLDYEYPKYRQISSTKFLLSDRAGGQDFLDFYTTENEFLKANPDVVREGTEDKDLISGYSFTKRYKTNCVLYLPNLSTSNYPVLYFNAGPGEDGTNTCSHIKNLKLRFTENNKEIIMTKNDAANVAIRLPPQLIDLPKQYGILVDMEKPDVNDVWEMGVYEPGKNKNTTVNRLKIDAKTGKFICAWWEYGQENLGCQK
ncbi:MAG: hypothetical protein AAB929_01175 [Patescibacteria group bacterium]